MHLLTSRRVEHEGECEAEPQEHLTYLGLTKRFPHCDQWVLHHYSLCEYCAKPEFEPLHQYRRTHMINYTGENLPGRSKCPAEERRTKAVINQWDGNRPSRRA